MFCQEEKSVSRACGKQHLRRITHVEMYTLILKLSCERGCIKCTGFLAHDWNGRLGVKQCFRQRKYIRYPNEFKAVKMCAASNDVDVCRKMMNYTSR